MEKVQAHSKRLLYAEILSRLDNIVNILAERQPTFTNETVQVWYKAAFGTSICPELHELSEKLYLQKVIQRHFRGLTLDDNNGVSFTRIKAGHLDCDTDVLQALSELIGENFIGEEFTEQTPKVGDVEHVCPIEEEPRTSTLQRVVKKVRFASVERELRLTDFVDASTLSAVMSKLRVNEDEQRRVDYPGPSGVAAQPHSQPAKKEKKYVRPSQRKNWCMKQEQRQSVQAVSDESSRFDVKPRVSQNKPESTDGINALNDNNAAGLQAAMEKAQCFVDKERRRCMTDVPGPAEPPNSGSRKPNLGKLQRRKQRLLRELQKFNLYDFDEPDRPAPPARRRFVPARFGVVLRTPHIRYAERPHAQGAVFDYEHDRRFNIVAQSWTSPSPSRRVSYAPWSSGVRRHSQNAGTQPLLTIILALFACLFIYFQCCSTGGITVVHLLRMRPVAFVKAALNEVLACAVIRLVYWVASRVQKYYPKCGERDYKIMSKAVTTEPI